MADAKQVENKQFETWQNATRGLVVLKKYNQRGDLGDEVVTAGRSIHITPTERRINQEMAANEDLDMFKNGTLAPLRIIDTEEDAKEIASNPNILSESEMKELFAGHWKAFDTRVNQIKNPQTLERMLEVASELDAKVRQVETIKERLAEVSPSKTTVIQAASEDGHSSVPRAVTPI